jgi:hypothetical protein
MWAIIAAEPSSVNINFFKEAQKRGIHTACLVAESSFPKPKCGPNELCNKLIVTRDWSEDACLEAISNAGLSEVLAIFPVVDAHAALAEVLEKKLSLRDTKLSPRAESRVKNQLREHVGSNDFFPNWEKCAVSNFDESVRTALRRWGQVVIKPLHGFQGIGVKIISSADEIFEAKVNLLGAIETLNARVQGLTDSDRFDASNHFLIEERIESTEFAMDGVMSQGRLVFGQICEKGERSTRFQEDQRYFAPPQLPIGLDQSARRAVQLIAGSYPDLTSAFHIEFKQKGNQAIIFDIGFRVGGAGLSDLIHFHASGVSLFGVWLDALLGNFDPPKPSNLHRPTLLYLGQVRSGGVVERVPSVAEMGFSPCVDVALEMHICKAGDCLRPFPNYTGHPNAALLVFPPNEMGRDQLEQAFTSCQKHLNPTYLVEV